MVFPKKLNPNRLTCIPRIYTLISLSPTFSFEPLSIHFFVTMSVDDTSKQSIYTRKKLNQTWKFCRLIASFFTLENNVTLVS